MRYKDQHDLIVSLCQTAVTLTEVETKLGTTTPNTSLRRYIRQCKIPMPFYEGQRAAVRFSQASRNGVTEADLCENSLPSTGRIKKFLIRTGKKQEKCEECGWCKRRPSDGKIPIELHHKNGESSDNRIENLQILCPSCHSLTPNYAGKNKRNLKRKKEADARRAYYNAPKHICETCGKLGYGERYCSVACAHNATRKAEWPTREQLEKEIETMSWTAIGRKYGVSDNAVRKWAKHYSLQS